MPNNGLEKKRGPYPVDDWDASTGTVYQFHGCYFHGHQCEVTKNVNISVPDEWSTELQGQFSHSPYEHFSEMSPIFCTTKVPFDAIGPCMQEYIGKQNMSQAGRTLLVGSMRAEPILLATPLLVWCLEHGLKVTKNHQVLPSFKVSDALPVSLTQFLLIGVSEMSQRIRKLREKTQSLLETRVTGHCAWIEPNGQTLGMSRVTKMPENK